MPISWEKNSHYQFSSLGRYWLGDHIEISIKNFKFQVLNLLNPLRTYVYIRPPPALSTTVCPEPSFLLPSTLSLTPQLFLCCPPPSFLWPSPFPLPTRRTLQWHSCSAADILSIYMSNPAPSSLFNFCSDILLGTHIKYVFVTYFSWPKDLAYLPETGVVEWGQFLKICLCDSPISSNESLMSTSWKSLMCYTVT